MKENRLEWLMNQSSALPFRMILTGWSNGKRGILKFNKGMCMVLYLGKNNPKH